MAKTERIKRKPEYDAEDWEAVGKLKEYVEGLGFTFAETENSDTSNIKADCHIEWANSYASAVGVRKTIPGIAEWLENLGRLISVTIYNFENPRKTLRIPYAQSVCWQVAEKFTA